MNLSNYPPGVTGNEPEIAGWPDEIDGEQCQLCDQPATHEVVHGGTVEMPHIGYYCKEHSDDYDG